VVSLQHAAGFTNNVKVCQINCLLTYGWLTYPLIPKLHTMQYPDYKNKCIDACLRCAAMCNRCAASCLKEENVSMMVPCIQLDMECAAVCYTAAQLMSLGSGRAKDLCRLCAELCEACATECEQHDNDHCRECASACRECEKECREMAA
jgi:hypothetical protein